MIKYLERKHIPALFSFVGSRFEEHVAVPDYARDVEGQDRLAGVFERTQMDDLYPEFSDKAVHILLETNKGHFFDNGNKRIAIAAFSLFLTLNGKELKALPKEEYRELLKTLFPERILWEDFDAFDETNFAAYNLAIVVAAGGEHEIEYEDLKVRVKRFIEVSVTSSAP